MSDDRLVEDVARAMVHSACPEGACLGTVPCVDVCVRDAANARAALAVAVPAVREECAVAADTVSAINQQAAAACPHVGSASIYVARAQGADETSAAIREGNANG